MGVRELLDRIRMEAERDRMDFDAVREDILAEHKRSTDHYERGQIIAVWWSFMDIDESNFALENLETFRKARRQEYCRLLAIESWDGKENIVPHKLEAVTRREVEAGRMSPDDELRRVALVGVAALPREGPMMWADRTALGLMGLAAVVIALLVDPSVAFAHFGGVVLLVILPLWLVLRIFDFIFGGPARRKVRKEAE